MLHDARDKNVLTVADSVYFKLCTHKVLVDKHGVLDTLVENDSHILFYIVIVEGDDHILSAKNV